MIYQKVAEKTAVHIRCVKFLHAVVHGDTYIELIAFAVNSLSLNK